MNKKNLTIVGVVLLALVVTSFWYINNNNQELMSRGQDGQSGIEGEEKNEEKTGDIEELKINDADRKNLFSAFMSYLSNYDQESFNIYKDKQLYASTGVIKNIKGKEYLETIIWIEGQHSTPYILAVKESDNWIVIFRGQDHPPCNIVDKHNIPNEVYDVCFDESGLRCTPNSKECY